MTHPADEWFVRTYKGAPTDSRAVIRAAYEAGEQAAKARAIATCDRVSALWIDRVAVSAVTLVRGEIAREN